MQMLTLDEQRALLHRQRRGYEMMDRQRRREWAELDYQQNLAVLDSLMAIACQHRQPQPTSGLVQWHRLMTRMGAMR